MRCICAGMMMFLLASLCVQPAKASEAQAALMGPTLDRSYVIPNHLSGEEKKWFKIFHEGNMVAAGWQKITADILASAPVEEHPAQRIALENLGLKIGLEWSRPNNVRKVDSSMLREWGGILKKTARENPQQLISAIAYIDRQVDELLD